MPLSRPTTAEDFFRAAAKAEGWSYHEWCRTNGILDEAALKQIDRHEVSRDALIEEKMVSKFVSDELDAHTKPGRSVLTSREDCAGLQHDAGGIAGPPNVARRRVSDAAEAAD